MNTPLEHGIKFPNISFGSDVDLKFLNVFYRHYLENYGVII